MKRREFITLLGGAAAACPFAARAQQTPGLPSIGCSRPLTASVENQRVAAFAQRLRELGWVEGRTVAIKVRWGERRSECTAEIVAEFVGEKVNVIVAAGAASVLAAEQGRSVVPIVLAGAGEVAPALRRLAILANVGNPVTLLDLRKVEAAAGPLGLTVVMVEIRRMEDIASGFEAL
jgi:putative ABC transport system substrate-binding protein